jgi:hypothetical protein
MKKLIIVLLFFSFLLNPKYLKFKISSVDWYLETRSPINDVKFFWGESNLPIIIEKSGSYECYEINSLLSSLQKCNNSYKKDYRLSFICYGIEKNDTLLIQRDGNIFYHGEYYYKSSELLKYLSKFLPCNMQQSMVKAFPEIGD